MLKIVKIKKFLKVNIEQIIISDCLIQLYIKAQMKQESKKQNLQKIRQKKIKNRIHTLQVSTDDVQQRIGQYTIHLGKSIGEGTYGKVYKASKQDSKQQFACKIIKKAKIDDLQILNKDIAKQLYDRLKTEGQFQLKLSKCPNIARMYKSDQNEKGFYFIMEYCETDLAKLLKKEGFLNQQTALNYFKQTLDGIKYIYQKNAFHRDLKPENLLLKGDTIKISDFGFVKIFTQIDRQCRSGNNSRFRAQSKVGTYKYMSPDILALLISESNTLQQKYDPQKSDVWSLGIILYKMLYGKEPFEGRNPLDMVKRIKQKKIQFPASIQFPPGKIIKTNVSKQVIKLIKRMCHPDQNERIEFMKLYSKVKALMQERKKEKLKSGIQDSQQIKKGKTEVQRSLKQRMLSVYNQLIVRTYRDLSNFATVRQIGIQNYSEYSYKIMTLIHQKRVNYLQNKIVKNNKIKQIEKQKDDQVDEKIRQQINQYQNTFYQQIKAIADLKPQQTLKDLLLKAYYQLENYQDFQLLIKEVQLFILFLLQLLCLELGIIKEDYICATNDKAQSLKSKSIQNFKSDAMKLIYNYLNGKELNISAEKTKKSSSKSRGKLERKGSRNKNSAQDQIIQTKNNKKSKSKNKQNQ